jgi:hypothetical protein
MPAAIHPTAEMEVETRLARVEATLLGGTVATGLLAGLLFGYACSVMPALSRLDSGTRSPSYSR